MYKLDVVIAFIITFLLLVFSVYKGIFVAYPLMIGFVLFFILSVRRGYPVRNILVMAYNGGKKSFIVLKIFILIGAITAIWMASGTVPAIVYYGIMLINPSLFILSAFLISCFVSILIGTSFGTVGTVGIALMVIARGGGVNLAAAGGAIIAGAYFGDRCSPMSSSASLVVLLTETNIYDNIKNMFKTSIIPFIISMIFYTIISLIFPLHNTAKAINNEIVNAFNVNIVVLIPALIIIVFAMFKINVKISMLVSIVVAFLLSIFIQNNTALESVKFIISGYRMDKISPLYNIIKGGGIISMLKTALVVFISSSFAGIFEGTGILDYVKHIIQKSSLKHGNFKTMILTSSFSSAFGCTQALAVILTHMLSEKAYENKSIFAVDLENTAIVIAALIPWNIALLVPMTNLGVNASCIPYLFYLYILPIINLIPNFKKAFR